MSSHTVKGAAIATLAYLAVALMGACAKLLPPNFPTIVILLFQSGVSFLCILPYVLMKGPAFLKTQRLPLHLLRTGAGLLAFFGLFYALQTISLPEALLLHNTAPFWVPLVLLLWQKERMNSQLWWGILIGFVGVILILKPGFSTLQLGMLVAIASGAALAIVLVAIRALTSTEPIARILFYYTLITALASLPFALAAWQPLSLHTLALLIGVGLFMFIAQILVNWAFTMARPALIAPLSYTVVVFAVLLGWLLFGHLPNWVTYWGMAFVILGGVYCLFIEQRS